MDLRQLRYFVAVAEERNFTAAARRLQLSQPSLSQQIQLLERRMGVPLLDRSVHPLRLTVAGQHFLEGGRRVLVAADKLVDEVRRRGTSEAGELRIGVVRFGLYQLLLPVVQQMRAAAPDVRLPVRQLAGEMQLAALRRGDVDVVLYRHTEQASMDDVRVVPLFDDPMMAILPTGHALSGGAEVPISALDQQPLVLVRRESMPIAYDRTLAALRDAGVEPGQIDEADDPYTLALSVASGMGIGLTGAGSADRYPGVEYLRVTPRIGIAEISLVWRDDADHPLRDAFVAAITASVMP